MLHRLADQLRRGSVDAAQEAFTTPQGVTLGWGTTVGNGLEGWAPGAIFVHTDAATDETLAYLNAGSKTTASWEAIPNATTLASTTAAEGASLVGVADAGSYLTGATVEAALAELVTRDTYNNLVILEDDFLQTGYTLASIPAPWTVVDTSSGGTPTAIPSADAHGGAIELKFATTDEAEAVGIDMNDELLFDVDSLVSFECRFRAPTLQAVDEIVIGMISGQADAPASLTEGAWISVDGNQDIDCESDDTAVRNDDKDSGVNLGNDVWCCVKILFAAGAAATFYLDATGLGAYAQVQAATAFTLSGYGAGLQPAAFITKASGAVQTNLDIDFIRVVATRV